MAKYNTVKLPFVFTPDEWRESWIPEYQKLEYQVTQDTVDVTSIGSYTRQIIPISVRWDYELVLPVSVVAPEIGTEGTVAFGDGHSALPQRVLFISERLEASHASEGWRILQLVGTGQPAYGVHMPELVKYRFELGDGTFVQMVMTKWEAQLFNKAEYIERVYGVRT